MNSAGARECRASRSPGQMRARDFLTVGCKCAAHDAQTSLPQPHGCCVRVSSARHRRSAVIAALTALTVPSTVPRQSPCALSTAGPATGLRRPRSAQLLARRAAARIARKAAGWEGRPGVIAILVLLIIQHVSSSWATWRMAMARRCQHDAIRQARALLPERSSWCSCLSASCLTASRRSRS